MANASDPTGEGVDSTSSSGGSSGGWADGVGRVSALPPQLKALAALSMTSIAWIVAFAQDPVDFVYKLITRYILGGILYVIRYIASTILLAFDYVVLMLDYLRFALVSLFGLVGIDILSALSEIRGALFEVVSSAGPGAPVITAIITVGVLALLYRAVVSIGSDIPVLGAILEFLGLT